MPEKSFRVNWETCIKFNKCLKRHDHYEAYVTYCSTVNDAEDINFVPSFIIENASTFAIDISEQDSIGNPGTSNLIRTFYICYQQQFV